MSTTDHDDAASRPVPREPRAPEAGRDVKPDPRPEPQPDPATDDTPQPRPVPREPRAPEAGR